MTYNADELKPGSYASLDEFKDSFELIKDVKSDLVEGKVDADLTPFFSIVIPTYRRGTSFARALDSALRQKACGIEWDCVVVDNTPPEEDAPARKIVRERADFRVLYYRNRQNIGSGYNWNRGVELARGKWIVFLHDDDILYPDALFQLKRMISLMFFGKKPLGYIHARRENFICDEELDNIKPRYVPCFLPLTRGRSLILGGTGTGVPSCGTAILKEAYLSTGGINYDYALTADSVLGYQIMKRYRVIQSDCSLGAYCWSENETLKKSSLLSLVQSDALFAQYRYSRNFFSKIWGRIFGLCEYRRNLDYKISTGEYKKFGLTYHDFDTIMPYRAPNLLVWYAYRFIQRIYRVQVAAYAMIRYLLKI